jgi:hypothetical protein
MRHQPWAKRARSCIEANPTWQGVVVTWVASSPCPLPGPRHRTVESCSLRSTNSLPARAGLSTFRPLTSTLFASEPVISSNEVVESWT